ncbi:DUF3757 domain-containing protein [Dickeya sp. CFBP 2040]|uniref:DUF3757 domain-containing protein n=1 Tax=Dickeya poaceiphila TaxID=568768 RepID=A0A5B8I6W9_9GAMM|nr:MULTISPECIES: DUF3757 domain-containing protein [Dickeya]NKI76263.1 DUF3757 domain-containing protein [Dickeya sp. CFBP 2040]QDX30143.1 DUF3757 domain-containing protein [Dickeya poaceiphila]
MANIHKISLFIVALTASSCVMSSRAQTLSCPTPESITYSQGVFVAQEKRVGWVGRWVSQKHDPALVKGFSAVEFISMKNSLKDGTLTNCTYSLSGADGVVDLSYQKKGDERKLTTLIVSISGQPNWKKEKGSVGIQGYECTKSVDKCLFTPLRIDAN